MLFCLKKTLTMSSRYTDTCAQLKPSPKGKSTLPREVIIEDKQAQEQLQLIDELYTDNKTIIHKMIDCFLTKKKFKGFF